MIQKVFDLLLGVKYDVPVLNHDGFIFQRDWDIEDLLAKVSEMFYEGRPDIYGDKWEESIPYLPREQIQNPDPVDLRLRQKGESGTGSMYSRGKGRGSLSVIKKRKSIID